jgi:hypothetical protein
MPGPSKGGLKQNEHIRPLAGARNIPHLWIGKQPAEFLTKSDARKVADRVGGEAYENPRSRLFLVRFA